MTIKALLKAIMPNSTIRWAIDRYGSARLARLPRAPLKEQNLRRREDLDLSEIFGLQPTSWSQDSAAIRAHLPDSDLEGGVNEGDRRAIYYLVRALEPQRVLEVGTHIGASTIHIAMALKANGRGKVITVDIVNVNDAGAWWKKVGLAVPPTDIARGLGCADLVEFVASDAQNFMRQTNERFDLIFLDGDHSAPAVYGELACALPILSTGGLILLHDYYPGGHALITDDGAIRGPFRALRRVARENANIVVQPLGELPWNTKKGSRMTSLAAVTRAS